MPGQIRAGHVAVQPVVAAIRHLSDDPLEQLSLVQQSTRLLVEYDSDRRVYGRADWHATLDEMVRRRARSGWTYLRDDCDGRAVFAAHLLFDLGIPWRLEASTLKRHAWISADLGGQRWDLLDLEADDPELQGWGYRALGRWLTRSSHPPPRVDLRRRWRERAGADRGLGLALGLVEAGSADAPLRARYVVNWTREPAVAGDPARVLARERTGPSAVTPDDAGTGLPAGGRSARDAAH